MNNETTAIVPAQLQLPATLGFDDAAGFSHMQRVAKMFAASALVPEQFKGDANLPNCVIALDMAKRLGANPLAVMQHLYIVHGKPGWSSQWIIGAVNTCGRFEPLRFDITGQGEAKECIAWTVAKGIRLPDGVSTLAQARDYDVAIYEGPACSINMAKAEGWYGKNGSKWKTMPDLMLRYRAATFFGRLYAPELLMGMRSVEEIIDIDADVKPLPPRQTLADAPPPPTVRKRTVTQVATQEPTAAPAPPPPKNHPTLVEAPISPDEKAEAEMGLAPATPPPAQTTIQDELALIVTGAGFTFDDFARWGRDQFPNGDASTGLLAWDALSGFSDLPDKAVKFFLRARTGMVNALKAAKGEGQ